MTVPTARRKRDRSPDRDPDVIRAALVAAGVFGSTAVALVTLSAGDEITVRFGLAVAAMVTIVALALVWVYIRRRR